MEVDAKASVELPKLPDYSPENGAMDFQDYLYLVEQMVGSLASGAGDWWKQALQVAQEAYDKYQKLSPIKRLSVAPLVPDDLRELKYNKLEKKVSTMILASLPRSVKEEIVAYRVQGVHEQLFRLMVIYQPGSATDRSSVLRQLDVTKTADSPEAAVKALRKWFHVLQRAESMSIKIPDQSLQARSLLNIMKKTLDQHSDLRFKVSLAKAELQIETLPTQENILKLYEHLVSETEQVAGGMKSNKRQGQQASTTTAAEENPKAKGANAEGAATPAAKAKSKLERETQKPCQWFAKSDDGCRRGSDCAFSHEWGSVQKTGRCLICSAIGHQKKDCPTKKGGQPATPTPSPPRQAPKIKAEKPTTESPTPTQPAEEPSPTAAQILADAAKVLKSMVASTSSISSTSGAVPSYEDIQKQLDELKMAKTIRMAEPEMVEAVAKGVLLDSGATHVLRPARDNEEMEKTNPVAVTLASEEKKVLQQTPAGSILIPSGQGGAEPQTIVPFGKVIEVLGCTLRWTRQDQD